MTALPPNKAKPKAATHKDKRFQLLCSLTYHKGKLGPFTFDADLAAKYHWADEARQRLSWTEAQPASRDAYTKAALELADLEVVKYQKRSKALDRRTAKREKEAKATAEANAIYYASDEGKYAVDLTRAIYAKGYNPAIPGSVDPTHVTWANDDSKAKARAHFAALNGDAK